MPKRIAAGVRAMKIYVGISRPKSKLKVGSLLIRFFEEPKSWLEPRSWFKSYKASHVFLAYPAHATRGFFMVNEAITTGVRWTSESFFVDHALILRLWCFDLPEHVYRGVKNYGDLMSGAPYPILENLGIGLQRIAKWFGFEIENPWDNNERAIKCSELFFRALFNHDPGLDIMQIKTDLWNEKGEYIPSDIDSLGVRDAELVLDWLKARGYCTPAWSIVPVQNSSAVTSGSLAS